jgi:hypothetical protein
MRNSYKGDKYRYQNKGYICHQYQSQSQHDQYVTHNSIPLEHFLFIFAFMDSFIPLLDSHLIRPLITVVAITTKYKQDQGVSPKGHPKGFHHFWF